MIDVSFPLEELTSVINHVHLHIRKCTWSMLLTLRFRCVWCWRFLTLAITCSLSVASELNQSKQREPWPAFKRMCPDVTTCAKSAFNFGYTCVTARPSLPNATSKAHLRRGSSNSSIRLVVGVVRVSRKSSTSKGEEGVAGGLSVYPSTGARFVLRSCTQGSDQGEERAH
mgnify:CR=1 FL=1